MQTSASRQIYFGAIAVGAVASAIFGAASTMAAPNDDLIARGKYLATAGDCIACHTAPGGKPFAGGLPVNTPYGAIITPNITPDKETGTGGWTDDQFYRAMHEGIGKDGGYLYPVFPFPSYTKVTREDVLAIKAYIDSLPAVHAPQKPNSLSFPYNVRSALAVWRGLYFRPGEFKPDAKQSADVNRGAYLVQGLGHCGECHTERNDLGASEKARALQGGSVDGWYAPNITSNVREGIGGWSNDQLFSFLKNGVAPGKGVVLGPMSQVVHESTHFMTDSDLRAIVAYLKSTPDRAREPEQEPAPVSVRAANTYLTYCASCHQADGKGLADAVPPLDGVGSVTAGGPENVIRTVLGGHSAFSTYGPMPAFGADMTDQEIADVTNYARTSWSNKAAANATPGMVGTLKKSVTIALAGKNPECPLPEDMSAAAKALADPNNPIGALLKGVTDANLLQGVESAIAKAKANDPKARTADIVNGLTAAYCPILAAEPGKKIDEQRWRLHRFGGLVYTQLVSPKDHM